MCGSVDIEVTPGGDGDIALATTGLTAGTLQADPTRVETEHSGSGVTGAAFDYTVKVPAGTSLARFDLDSIDDTADLDLTVYLVDRKGTPVAGWQSATGDADERVDIADPAAGTYLVYVDVYSASTATAFDLTTFAVTPGGAPLTLAPPVIAGQQGVTTTVTASWSGLTPSTSYLGEISYGSTGASTLLEVVTGEPVGPVNTVLPVISGNPVVGGKLTATAGEWGADRPRFAYQWQRNGIDIPRATRSTHKVVAADRGAALTVVVTATVSGLPDGTATSAAVTVK